MPGLQHGRACSSFRNGKRVTQGALHAFPIVSIMQCALTCCVLHIVLAVLFAATNQMQATPTRPYCHSCCVSPLPPPDNARSALPLMPPPVASPNIPCRRRFLLQRDIIFIRRLKSPSGRSAEPGAGQGFRWT